MIDIFMTTWQREKFTHKSIDMIHERTEPGSFQLHVFDNNSDSKMREYLLQLLSEKKIVSLHLDSRNTGCLYNKGVFHMMVESTQKYYCLTDNDVLPPKLSPDWLSQMIGIMDAHPELAFLVPQIPPQWLQGPDLSQVKEDIVYCKAVGNTFKIVRRSAFPISEFMPVLGAYGDDALVCEQVKLRNYKVAFCRNIFCFHAGQCENWGYSEEEVAMDPRKSGYGKPFTYKLLNEETFEPYPENRI